ncbi:MAG: bifunctional glutathionylspermidine amidase/synthase [Alphaproteobacteria bacterium]|nr:bifunctional glutathionylspermidine amidase/synthase [Alphaproteobacteria bacterium]MCB9929108.1 bifunctional glutathionylspermidine amidase/synthase [Alphaproteobacteria bacterium]
MGAGTVGLRPWTFHALDHHHGLKPAPFGTVLGYGPGGVPVYSSDYASADERRFPNRQAYRSTADGVYLGHKWQCVELARRWLYQTRGYVFEDIAMAYDIFRLRQVRVVADGSLLPLQSFRNGAKRPPEPGALLIWDEGGEFEVTGHVAVVTEVGATWVRCIEQNVEDIVWPAGQTWSRQLPLHRTADGGWQVACTFPNGIILGWVIQTDDATHAERVLEDEPALFRIQRRALAGPSSAPAEWLDTADPMQATYVRAYGGHTLSDDPADMGAYYAISETALREVRRAANELHRMFLHATNHVLENEALLERFNLPPALRPRLRQSWANRRNHMITGRFDFALRPDGLKAYEYNADSASCYMESGFLFQRWAHAFGCTAGRDPADGLHAALVEAWRESGVPGLLHIMRDDDPEESYHALFMRRAIEEAGIRCKLVRGTAGLQWGEGGRVLDADGEPILWVWKTWAWETALDQIRHDLDDDAENLRLSRTIDRATQKPRLVDVLLREEVMVFEPLWTLVTSNKAILPVVKQMFPSSRFLLDTRFELADDLRERGYAAKPIVGRCGANIALYNRREDLMAETAGQFDDRDTIYQELFRLPQVDGRNAQIQAFTVAGHYAGAGIRMDRSLIITTDSDLLPLRVLPDEDFLTGA